MMFLAMSGGVDIGINFRVGIDFQPVIGFAAGTWLITGLAINADRNVLRVIMGVL